MKSKTSPITIDERENAGNLAPNANPLASIPDEPALPIHWAVARKGTGVRCLLHRALWAESTLCRGGERQRWLLYPGVSSRTEALENLRQDPPPRRIVSTHEHEMQIAADNKNGPLIALAIPPERSVIAAQVYLRRWAAIKVSFTAITRQALAA